MLLRKKLLRGFVASVPKHAKGNDFFLDFFFFSLKMIFEIFNNLNLEFGFIIVFRIETFRLLSLFSSIFPSLFLSAYRVPLNLQPVAMAP